MIDSSPPPSPTSFYTAPLHASTAPGTERPSRHPTAVPEPPGPAGTPGVPVTGSTRSALSVLSRRQTPKPPASGSEGGTSTPAPPESPPQFLEQTKEHQKYVLGQTTMSLAQAGAGAATSWDQFGTTTYDGLSRVLSEVGPR